MGQASPFFARRTEKVVARRNSSSSFVWTRTESTSANTPILNHDKKRDLFCSASLRRVGDQESANEVLRVFRYIFPFVFVEVILALHDELKCLVLLGLGEWGVAAESVGSERGVFDCGGGNTSHDSHSHIHNYITITSQSHSHDTHTTLTVTHDTHSHMTLTTLTTLIHDTHTHTSHHTTYRMYVITPNDHISTPGP